ncbi:hypothetical protein BDU57DRAFT_508511 [Ampelomyces quisqualis]|uniref:Uncharacterized protein n=1 Tax=Ampelomyces quisqualis TaxID=50730 RepID=A0A6A5R0E1_AMPQU|nr:hypothetical protein BDU57DRAFT_508511 [Ampelomyces quisqualis]
MPTGEKERILKVALLTVTSRELPAESEKQTDRWETSYAPVEELEKAQRRYATRARP